MTTQRVVPAITCNGWPISPGVISGGSSSNGHHVGRAVIVMALDVGMPDGDDEGHDFGFEQAAREYEDYGNESDWQFADSWHDMVTEAEEWLNMHTASGMWSWSDGDFRVDAVADCPHCGEPRFADPDVGDEDCASGHLSWY